MDFVYNNTHYTAPGEAETARYLRIDGTVLEINGWSGTIPQTPKVVKPLTPLESVGKKVINATRT